VPLPARTCGSPCLQSCTSSLIINDGRNSAEISAEESPGVGLVRRRRASAKVALRWKTDVSRRVIDPQVVRGWSSTVMVCTRMLHLKRLAVVECTEGTYVRDDPEKLGKGRPLAAHRKAALRPPICAEAVTSCCCWNCCPPGRFLCRSERLILLSQRAASLFWTGSHFDRGD
jgi:hypothetical protein